MFEEHFILFAAIVILILSGQIRLCINISNVKSDDVDVLEKLHAVGLAEYLGEGVQLARLHVPLHESADAAELRP